MNNVWLVKIVFTDDCTYSYREVVAVCTNKIDVIKTKYTAEKYYPSYQIEIEEVAINRFLG